VLANPKHPFRDAVSLLCGGETPPEWVVGHSCQDIPEERWHDLSEWMLAHTPLDWSTGIGLVEAAESIVKEAVSNGNIPAAGDGEAPWTDVRLPEEPKRPFFQEPSKVFKYRGYKVSWSSIAGHLMFYYLAFCCALFTFHQITTNLNSQFGYQLTALALGAMLLWVTNQLTDVFVSFARADAARSREVYSEEDIEEMEERSEMFKPFFDDSDDDDVLRGRTQ